MYGTAFLAVAIAIPATSFAGQTAAAVPSPEPGATTWSVRNWTRTEAWRFFEPAAGGGDHDYVYVANRLQAGVRRTAPRYDVTAALQYVHFGGLPSGAVGPGPLGPGAVYFAHAGRSDSASLGVAKGGDVVRRTFVGSTMTFGYVENVLQF